MPNPAMMFKALKLGAAGVFATGLGVLLLVNPDLGAPTGPRQFSDFVPGICALVVGLVILGFCVWVFRRPGPQ